MYGSGDPTLPFFVPTLNLFSICLGKKNWCETLVRKGGMKIYFWLSTAFVCNKPLHLAAMFQCVCCLQYIQKLSVAHTGDFNHTNYALK